MVAVIWLLILLFAAVYLLVGMVMTVQTHDCVHDRRGVLGMTLLWPVVCVLVIVLVLLSPIVWLWSEYKEIWRTR